MNKLNYGIENRIILNMISPTKTHKNALCLTTAIVHRAKTGNNTKMCHAPQPQTIQYLLFKTF